MIKMNSLFALLFLLFMGSTCKKENEDCHRSIKVINEWIKPIYITCDTHYPDTLHFGHFSSPALDPYMNKVIEGTSNDRALRSRDCWEVVFDTRIPSDTLMVYVFDAEVLETVPWSIVVQDHLVLKRYNLSLSDLRQMNWLITYP